MRYIITTLLLLAFATSSHADRAWVLWSHGTFVDQGTWEVLSKSNSIWVDVGWIILSDFPTHKQCTKAIEEMYQRGVNTNNKVVQDKGAKLVDIHEKFSGIEKITSFIVWDNGYKKKLTEVDYKCLRDTAQESHKTKAPHTFKEAISACIVIVRKETDDRVNLKISNFDAYLKPDGKVEFFGNTKEHFSFRKCMNEKGHTLE